MSYSQQGGPTPRRSHRLSSATPSVALSATTATAARRKAALPKAKARQSQAYGSGSRVKAAEELAIPTTGFFQAFNQQRGNAMARDEDGPEEEEEEEEEPVNPQSDHSRPTSKHEAVRQWQYESVRVEHFSENGDDSPTPSSLDRSKSYGGFRETGLLQGYLPHTNGIQKGDQERLRQPIEEIFEAPFHEFAGDEEPEQRPWFRRYLGERLNQYIDELGLGILYGLFFAFIMAAIALLVANPFNLKSTTGPDITKNGSTGASIMGAFSSRVAYEYDRFAHWIQPPEPPAEPPIDKFDICDHPSVVCDERGVPTIKFDIMSVRMFRIEGEHRQSQDDYKRLAEKHEHLSAEQKHLSAEHKDIQEAIHRFESKLPNAIIVTRNKNGQPVIPDEFWQAISGRILSDESNSTPTWDEFFAKNEAKITGLVQREFDSPKSKTKLDVLLREEIAQAMEEHYVKYSKRVDHTIAQVKKDLANELKPIAAEEARMAVFDRIRLQSLAVTNLVANAELNLHKVNYFSTGLGARVDAGFTSPTSSDQNKVLATIYRSLFAIPIKPPPVAALLPWDEPGDCWCAAIDRRVEKSGRAQLAVILGVPIHPTQVTIEHLPRGAAPRQDLSTAPKSIELWAQIDDPDQRPAASCKGDGPTGYVCLGEFQYNIDGSNHIQTFNLDEASLQPVTKIVVRVASNWGGAHTCLYRVRLHGSGPDVGYEELGNSW
jgi:hypothetical protein